MQEVSSTAGGGDVSGEMMSKRSRTSRDSSTVNPNIHNRSVTTSSTTSSSMISSSSSTTTSRGSNNANTGIDIANTGNGSINNNSSSMTTSRDSNNANTGNGSISSSSMTSSRGLNNTNTGNGSINTTTTSTSNNNNNNSSSSSSSRAGPSGVYSEEGVGKAEQQQGWLWRCVWSSECSGCGRKGDHVVSEGTGGRCGRRYSKHLINEEKDKEKICGRFKVNPRLNLFSVACADSDNSHQSNSKKRKAAGKEEIKRQGGRRVIDTITVGMFCVIRLGQFRVAKVVEYTIGSAWCKVQLVTVFKNLLIKKQNENAVEISIGQVRMILNPQGLQQTNSPANISTVVSAKKLVSAYFTSNVLRMVPKMYHDLCDTYDNISTDDSSGIEDYLRFPDTQPTSDISAPPSPAIEVPSKRSSLLSESVPISTSLANKDKDKEPNETHKNPKSNNRNTLRKKKKSNKPSHLKVWVANCTTCHKRGEYYKIRKDSIPGGYRYKKHTVKDGEREVVCGSFTVNPRREFW